MREATKKAMFLGSAHFKQKITSQINSSSDNLMKGDEKNQMNIKSK